MLSQKHPSREVKMKTLVMVVSVLIFVVLGAGAPTAHADTTSLQSVLFNVNGTTQMDFTGANVGGFNTTTGLGTLTYTYNPGPGIYFFDVFFDHSLNKPFFNEFGTVNGAPAAGQTYEIGDSFASNIYNDVQAGGALPDTNSLPGQASNFLNSCVGANCNGDFAAAMGFAFTLAAGQQELITLAVSHTDPGGFTLQDTHPVDPANTAALQLFLSGGAVTEPIGTKTVPEPGSLLLVGTGMLIASAFLRKKLHN
jgi:hypothetical protein